MSDKLKEELKGLYALIEAPSDDEYWPEIQERINEITKLLKDHAKIISEKDA
jgi:hypothetical protein